MCSSDLMPSATVKAIAPDRNNSALHAPARPVDLPPGPTSLDINNLQFMSPLLRAHPLSKHHCAPRCSAEPAAVLAGARKRWMKHAVAYIKRAFLIHLRTGFVFLTSETYYSHTREKPFAEVPLNETMYRVLLALRSSDQQAADILDGLRHAGSEIPSLAAFYRSLKSGLTEGWLEIAGSDASGPRSEARRGGQGCRSRGSPYH